MIKANAIKKSPQKSVQRLMKFEETVDVTEVKIEHRFSLDYAKKYIKNKKLLNIGSWTGPFETLAVEYTNDITSIDIDERPLAVLKKNLPKVNTIKASAEDLPFRNNTFDVVTFWAVIEHIPVGYELAALREINRVLKPGGYIFLSTMSYNFWSNLLDPGYWMVGHRHYTKAQLSNMLNRANFTVDNSLEAGSFITAFHAWGFYFFKHIMRMQMPEIKFIEQEFEKDFSAPGFYQIAMRAIKNN